MDAPHSSHGGTFVGCSTFVGGWTGVVAAGFTGKGTWFWVDASDFTSGWFTFPFLLGSLATWNWLGVWERDNADAAPPTAWLAVQ